MAPTLTPEFAWSPFRNDLYPVGQAGYQLRVYDGLNLVYNTGFVADPAGNLHRYTPGAYTGSDGVSGDVRISQALTWNRAYRCQVRYRDNNGRWTDWSEDAPGSRVDFFTASPGTALVQVGDAVAEAQEDFLIPIQIQLPAVWPLDSFAFDLVFDGGLMEYAACRTEGTLSAGWNVTGTQVSANVLRVLGAPGSGGPIAQSGTLLNVSFYSRGGAWQSAAPSLANAAAGLAGYPTAAGAVQWYQLGDPTRDHRVTPGDAQCAFAHYLGASTLGELERRAADVDRDGSVTPGDAHDIFGMYLSPAQKTGIPSGEGAPAARRGAARALALAVHEARAGDAVTLPVNVRGAEHLVAYGLDVRFDPSRLNFEEASRQDTACRNWSLLSARLVEPGRLRVGASAGTAEPFSGDGALVLLRFSVASGAPTGPAALWVENLADGLARSSASPGAVEVLPDRQPVAPPVGVNAAHIGFFVLDDFGAVHAGGAARNVVLSGGPYFGWNIARAMQPVAGPAAQNEARLGIAVLDGFGALHTYSARRPSQSFYFYPEPGDRAVDLELCHVASEEEGEYGFFVLDRNGGLWAGGSADPAVAEAASITPPLNGVTQYAVDLVLTDDSGAGGWILDNMGGVHAFGGAPAVAFALGTQNNWKRLVRAGEAFARVDAFGRVEWSGRAAPDWTLPLVDGGLLADVEVADGPGLVALDRFGALYASQPAALPAGEARPPYFGFEAARDLELAVLPEPETAGFDPASLAPAPRSYRPLDYAYSLATGMEMQRLDAALAGARTLPVDLDRFVAEKFGAKAAGLARDSWDQPYRLLPAGEGYYLVSSGPDRKPGTSDDLWIDHAE
ncbi:hypothetical protein HS125_04265 [bacterium]|nr:hypothetical protein [bacterium]